MSKRTPLDLVRARPGPPHTVTFDGRELPALPGQTVAAALWTAGITAWRTTRRGGEPRGIFCGIGVCFDCLVRVNDRPNQRACLTPATPGDEIRTQRGSGHEGGGDDGDGDDGGGHGGGTGELR